jgi:hypothetical protein
MPVLSGIRFDLADTRRATTFGNDIRVTGRRRGNRLEPLPDLAPEQMPRAGFGLFGPGKLTLDVAPTLMPNGTQSNRLMPSWKVKFRTGGGQRPAPCTPRRHR